MARAKSSHCSSTCGQRRDHGLDEHLDEFVIGGAAHAFVPPAEVDGIGEPLLVVGADIEQDGKRVDRMDSGAGGVESELADGDAHAAGALVAESENAFAVADDDDANVVMAAMVEDLVDAVAVWIAQEQAARLSPNGAETLAALAHGGRVDERQHLFDIAHQQGVEERLVRVLQVAQKSVLLEGRGKSPQRMRAGGKSDRRWSPHGEATCRAGRTRRARPR